MEKEEVLRLINAIEVELHWSNVRESQEIDREASKYDIYNGVTDRNYYIAERKLPERNIKKENVYDELIRRSKLAEYFTQSDFDIIYDVCKQKNKNTFYFNEEFCALMKRYVIFKEYIKDNDAAITFSKFVEDEIYEKLLREEEYNAWKEETEEIQRNFVPKSNSELKQMYEKYKFFLDKIYRENVDELGCMDILPFSEYLVFFDRADRNYRNIEGPIDHKLMREIVNKYYDLFVANRGYQEKISFMEFWKMFNKCNEMENKNQFKVNITNLVDEYIANLDENIELDNLYNAKKRV